MVTSVDDNLTVPDEMKTLIPSASCVLGAHTKPFRENNRLVGLQMYTLMHIHTRTLFTFASCSLIYFVHVHVVAFFLTTLYPVVELDILYPTIDIKIKDFQKQRHQHKIQKNHKFSLKSITGSIPHESPGFN